MKKLYNKALMYQNYYSGRWPLLIGIIMFIFVSYYSLIDDILNVKMGISHLASNKMGECSLFLLLTSWIILFAVYFAITGLNKKSVMQFLQSGPFSKEEIKMNQITALFITLMLIILSYVYVFICVSFKEQNLVSLIPNYYNVFFKDIIRILICGIAFISYLNLMDVLFSNVILEVLMIIITPFLMIVSFAIITNVFTIISNTSMYEYPIMRYFTDLLNSIHDYLFGQSNWEYLFFNKKFVISLIAAASLILFLVAWHLNKTFKMNKCNKLFNSDLAENFCIMMLTFLPVLCIGNIIINFSNKNIFLEIPHRTTMIIFLIFIILCVVTTHYLRKLISRKIKKYL